jgi:hypothetical protein
MQVMKGGPMNVKVLGFAQMLAAMAIIYFGQQLLRQGKRNLGA